MPALGRQRLGHRHRFHKTDKADQGGRPEELGPYLLVKCGHAERGKIARDVAEDFHALLVHAKYGDDKDTGGDREDRASACNECGRLVAKTQTPEKRLQPGAGPEQKCQRGEPYCQCRQVNSIQRAGQRQHQFKQVVALSRHAQDMFEL